MLKLAYQLLAVQEEVTAQTTRPVLLLYLFPLVVAEWFIVESVQLMPDSVVVAAVVAFVVVNGAIIRGLEFL